MPCNAADFPQAIESRPHSISDGFRLNLNLVVPHKPSNLDRRVGRSNDAQIAAVHVRHRVRLISVLEVGTGLHDVVEPGAERRQTGGNLVEK